LHREHIARVCVHASHAGGVAAGNAAARLLIPAVILRNPVKYCFWRVGDRNVKFGSWVTTSGIPPGTLSVWEYVESYIGIQNKKNHSLSKYVASLCPRCNFTTGLMGPMVNGVEGERLRRGRCLRTMVGGMGGGRFWPRWEVESNMARSLGIIQYWLVSWWVS
jgi:hypothetical protein